MADNAPSPTPSEDNQRNERDDLMSKALDGIMNSQVQSYDNFVNNFLFLKESKYWCICMSNLHVRWSCGYQVWQMGFLSRIYQIRAISVNESDAYKLHNSFVII